MQAVIARIDGDLVIAAGIGDGVESIRPHGFDNPAAERCVAEVVQAVAVLVMHDAAANGGAVGVAGK